MEIKSRVFNRCFIALFMAILALPLIFIDLSSDRVSTKENRMLAPFPKLTDLKHHQGQFIRDFDTWFKDSTGFREQFLELYNVIAGNRWLNGIRVQNGQLVFLFGEHGHRFTAGVNGCMISKFQGKQFLPDEKLSGMADKLEMVKTYLDKKNIPLIVMFCADKESVYYEYYPKSIKRGKEPIQLDIITRYLQDHTNVDVFNIRQALLAEKDEYLLFNVSADDIIHYNEIGAFFAYRELMKHINMYFPEMVPYELNDIEIIYDNEGVPDVKLKSGYTYQRLDSSFFNDVEVSRPFIWDNVAFQNTKPDLPVILVVRDSFCGFYYETSEKRFITQFIASHFGQAIFIHYINLEHFEEYIVRYKPDIVVIEASESQFEYLAEKIILISEFVDVHSDYNGVQR